jgi:hypothetical protein
MGAAEKLQAFAERLAVQSASDLSRREIDGEWDALRCVRSEVLQAEAETVYGLIEEAVADCAGIDVETEQFAPAEQRTMNLVDAALQMLVLRFVDQEQKRADDAAKQKRIDADRVEP